MTAEVGNYKFSDSMRKEVMRYTEKEEEGELISEQSFDELIAVFLDAYRNKDIEQLDVVMYQLSRYLPKMGNSESTRNAKIFEKVASLLSRGVPSFVSKTAALTLRKFYRYYSDGEVLEKFVDVVVKFVVSEIERFGMDEICMYMALVRTMCLRDDKMRDMVLAVMPVEFIYDLIGKIINLSDDGVYEQAIKELLNVFACILRYNMKDYIGMLEIVKNLVNELGNVWIEQICNIIYELVSSENDIVIDYLVEIKDYYEMVFETTNRIAKQYIISTLLKIFYLRRICCINYRKLIYLTKYRDNNKNIKQEDDYVSTQAMILVFELINFDNSLYQEFTNYELLHILKANIQFGSFEVKKQAGFCLAFLTKFATTIDFHQLVFIDLFSPAIGLFQIENDELNKQILSLILRLTNYVLNVCDIQEKQLFLNNVNNADGYNIISELVEENHEYSSIGSSILIDLEDINDSILNEQNQIMNLYEE